MKKIFTLAFVALAALSASAQYICMKPGTVLTYDQTVTVEDKTNTLTATTTILEATTGDNGVVNVKSQIEVPIPGKDFGKFTENSYASYNPADSTTTIIVAGEEDSKASVINLIKTQFEAAGQVLSPSQLEELDKSIKVKGELKIDIKPNVAPGTTGPKQTLRISFGPETMTMNLWELKFEGVESVTVPAGTYDCMKVTYVHRIKAGTNIEKKLESDWYAPGVGIVKNVTCDSKGKEVSSTVLTSIKEQ